MIRGKKIILLPIVCIMVLTMGGISCVSKVFTAKSQKAFFSLSPGNIKDYIETDGYYRCDSDLYSWYVKKNLLIYDDQSFVFFDWDNHDCPSIYSLRPWKQQIEYEDSLNNTQDVDLFENIKFMGYEFSSMRKLEGGAYTIEDNRLILEQPVLFDYYSKRVICRNIFKIIDRRTLLRETFQLVRDDSIIQIDTVATFHFVPAHNIPSSLVVKEKKYKWMWKDFEEWKQYKNLRKEYMRNKQ